MPSFFRSILNPSLYHGKGKTPPFFEGWYYKLVSADERERIAVIPAVFLGEREHAFIQVVDGVSETMDYHTYPLSDFRSDDRVFDIRIGDSSFNLNGLTLQLDSPEGSVEGSVQLHNLSPWPVSLLSPGVMGWYAWVPAMECYHGVLSFDHSLSGSLAIQGRRINFDGGRGYLEKDWGASFPEGYVWMQTNHFPGGETSLMASVAVIPWLGSAFPGFILGLMHQGRLYRLTTYTGAVLEQLEIEEEHVHITAASRELRLQIRTTRPKGIPLKGPTKQDMGMRVDESLAAEVQVQLSRKDGKIIFEGTGLHAGLEVVNSQRLLARVNDR